MKKLMMSILMGFIVFLCCGISVKALNPTERFYINDYADILSAETEDFVFEHSKYLESKTKAQIVVVTVPSLEGQDLESYANELFNHFGIGDAEENNGLLLLLALEEREFRVEVGYGLEGVITDGLSGRYQDNYLIPFLREDKWDEGIKNGYSAFFKKLCEYYDIEDDVQEEGYDVTVVGDDINFSPQEYFIIYSCIIMGFSIGIWGAFKLFGEKKKKKKKQKKYIDYIFTSILIINILMLIYCYFYSHQVWVLGDASESVSILDSELVTGIISFLFTSTVLCISKNGGNNFFFYGGSSRGYSSGSSFGGGSSFHGGGGFSGGGGSSRHF